MISSTDAIRTPRISDGARLLDLLFQFIEDRTVEKFPKGDFQSVAYLMNGNDARIVAFLVKHTVIVDGEVPAMLASVFTVMPRSLQSS